MVVSYTKKRAAIIILLFILVLALLGVTLYKGGYNSIGRVLEQISASTGTFSRGNNPLIHYTTYQWDPNNATRIFPFAAIPAGTGTGSNISINTTPGEYEDASFILSNGAGTASAINLTVSPLIGTNGTLAASAVDLKFVKVWNRDYGLDTESNQPGATLIFNPVPELMLNNDSLVSANVVTGDNYLWESNATWAGYIHISSPTDTQAPFDYTFNDSPTLQSLTLQQNENRQVWVTVNAPAGTNPGTYTGNISIMQGSSYLGNMTLSVTVLPFTLPAYPGVAGIYDYGSLTTTQNITELDLQRNNVTYLADMQDLAKHGAVNVAFYQLYTNWTLWKYALQLRQQAGLNNSVIFNLYSPQIEAGTRDINYQSSVLKMELANGSAFGVNKFVIYGQDESNATILAEEQQYATLLAQNGSLMWVACNGASGDVFAIASKYLNYDVQAGTNGAVNNPPYSYNSTLASLMHGVGNYVLSYNNPQSGSINATIYRQNYGFRLWYNGYDGPYTWAYQYSWGVFSWNDQAIVNASGGYRTSTMAYPTSSGVVDTIEWEGYREGIDDVRYVETLINTDGGNTSQTTYIVGGGLSANVLPEQIRANIITQILIDIDSLPQFTYSQSTSTAYSGTEVSFTSTNLGNGNVTPSYAWYVTPPGGSQTLFSTVQNPQYVFMPGTPGIYIFNLTVTNPGGGTNVTTSTVTFVNETKPPR
jgi:hypothetical protein